MKPKMIFVHTAAHGRSGVPIDTSAQEIDRWHRARGWSGIGYHAVIRFDGRVEPGRAMSRTGAHVRGYNGRSLGVCCSGHGDLADFTDEQKAALATLLSEWCRTYGIAATEIYGHREVNVLEARAGSKRYRTTKSCPGHKIDMDEVRASAMVEFERPSDLRAGFRTLYAEFDRLDAPVAPRELLNRLRHDSWVKGRI